MIPDSSVLKRAIIDGAGVSSAIFSDRTRFRTLMLVQTLVGKSPYEAVNPAVSRLLKFELDFLEIEGKKVIQFETCSKSLAAIFCGPKMFAGLEAHRSK